MSDAEHEVPSTNLQRADGANLHVDQRLEVDTREVPSMNLPNGGKNVDENESSVPSSVPTKTPLTTPVPPARTKKRKVAELKCSEVRWFYRKNDSEKWSHFNGRDSITLEMKYRLTHKIELDEQAVGYCEEINLHTRDMVVVLDGLYKLNEDQRLIEAIYWKEDTCEVRRGTWFTSDYQPMDPLSADSIDRHHLQYFRGHAIPEGTTVFSSKEASNKPQLTELHLENMEVRWSSVIDICLAGKRGALMRYIGWSKNQPLRRGFEKEAEWTDAPAEISHLILVVHGIGQKGYENLIAQNAQQVREGVDKALEKHYPEEKSRPMFLPVEWRSGLKLDDGVTDHLTLPKMSSMRSALNSTAMDIMYYQSPLYRQEIIAGVTRQMNRVYSLFKENNPTFRGPVSVFAHSLGSVIVYDILIQFSPLLLYDQYVTQAIATHLEKCEDEESRSAMKDFQEVREKLHESLNGGISEALLTNEEKLKFKVKNLYAVGSPLGVFMVMRGGSHGELHPSRLDVERIYNIFHPYDPVAYRLEPLFDEAWKNIRPLKLFASNDLRGRNAYDELPLDVYKAYMKKLKSQGKTKKNSGDKAMELRSGEEELDEEDECDSDEDGRSGYSSPRSVSPPPLDDHKAAKKGGWFSFSSSNKKPTVAPQEHVAVEEAKEAEADLPLAERILGAARRPPFRIDFQLQPAITDKSYWSVLKSHFSYWTNSDLALFMANSLYLKSAITDAHL